MSGSIRRCMNRYQYRRERSLSFTRPGNFYTMGPLFEERWQYPTSNSLAVISPPWTVTLDNTHNGVTPNLLKSGDATTLGVVQIKRIPVLFNPLQPWQITGSFQFMNPSLTTGTQLNFLDGSGTMIFRFRVTAGPTFQININDSLGAIVGTQICTGYLPGQWVYFDYLNNGSPDGVNGSASFRCTLSPTGVTPNFNQTFLNVNMNGVPNEPGGMFITTNAPTDLVGPYMIGVGPIGLYGAQQ